MTDWKEYKLEQITEPVKETYLPTIDESIPYIGLEHIEPESLRLISIGNSSDVTSNKFKFRANDVLFGKLRPYFRKVVKPQFDGICSTDIWVFRAKEDINQDYLYYFLANWDFVNTANSADSGTRMPRADWVFLKDTLWDIPEGKEQTSIAKILSCLDDKIDLLHRQNNTLEALAETLFRQWFVEEAEESWVVYRLRDLVKHVKPGTNYQPPRITTGIPFLNVRNLNNGFLDTTDISKISNEDYMRVHKSWQREVNDLLISRIGTLGLVAVITEHDIPVAVHYNMINLKANKVSYQFLYFLLKSKWFQEKYSTNIRQSVQEYVAIEDVENIELPLPLDQESFKDYENSFNIMFTKIKTNRDQIRTITQLRDTLLPKLMSGEVRVEV